MRTSLQKRIISAAVLAPVCLYALIYDGILFWIMIAAAFALSLFEWVTLARKGKPFWFDIVMGTAYLATCFTAFLILRYGFETGVFLSLCLILIVWASDIGAYISGKILGGAKFAPDISPKKTWTGLIGGMVTSGLVAFGLNFFAGSIGGVLGINTAIFTSIIFIALGIGAILAYIGQIGDLYISSLKRRVGVKDTGDIIPGHGGILDRIDSLLLAAPFFLICMWAIHP